MRVRATATGTSQSNAIGQVELSCTPAGLSIGLYGVGSYSEGYATGALTSGTRFTIPYGHVRAVRLQGEEVYLEVDAPGFPHNRLTLSRFSAGPGVPLTELHKRRLILQFSAFSAAAIATLAGTMLAPVHTSERLAWGALGYGAVAGAIVLALGYSLDQSLFVRPPGEEATREAFLSELSLHYPNVLRSGALPPRKRAAKLPEFTALLPRTASAIGITLATVILTGLVTGQRLMTAESERKSARQEARAERESPGETEELSSPEEEIHVPTSPPDNLHEDDATNTAPPDTVPSDIAPAEGEVATVERRCMCDRADSQLWKGPIPKLSGVLIEQRALPRKNYTKTQIQLAVVNNSDTPINEITLHVQFFERRGKERVATKERPLYFEGPLAPGEAIKWSAEARGTEFEVSIPDLGTLGPNGTGSAPLEAFVDLLEAANHRPVRLHAARLLGYLGDARARDGALALKDAMRAAEAPYLRRILAATGETRVCDIDVQKGPESSVGVCVYNASGEAQQGLGVQLHALSGPVDVDHPLAEPPSILRDQKWHVPGKVEAQAGRYVRLKVPSGFLVDEGQSLDVTADRHDLLE